MARTGTIIHSYEDEDNYLGMGQRLYTFEVDFRFYPSHPGRTDYYFGHTPEDPADADILEVRLINEPEMSEMEKKYVQDSFEKYVKDFEAEYYNILEQIIIQQTEDCYD